MYFNVIVTTLPSIMHLWEMKGAIQYYLASPPPPKEPNACRCAYKSKHTKTWLASLTSIAQTHTAAFTGSSFLRSAIIMG